MVGAVKRNVGMTLNLTTDEANALAAALGRIADQSENQSLDAIYNVLMDNGASDGAYNVLTVDFAAGTESEERDDFIWVVR